MVISTKSGLTYLPIDPTNEVTSLNGEKGDITLTSSGGTVTITTPTAHTINLEAGAEASLSATSLLGNPTSSTHNAEAISVGVEDGFIGTQFTNIMEFADYATLTAGANVDDALVNFRISGFQLAIARGVLNKSIPGDRVRIMQRCMAGYPLTITDPDVILPFIDNDFPLQYLRQFTGSSNHTSFYSGAVNAGDGGNANALANLQQPAVWLSLLAHAKEIQVDADFAGSSKRGACIGGNRYWQMLSTGTGAVVGSQGAGGYVNGETVYLSSDATNQSFGGLLSPFIAPAFTLTVVAGSVTALTPVAATLGVLPAPPKTLRKMFGDVSGNFVTAWVNPVTGYNGAAGPTWAANVANASTTQAFAVYDASGNYLTTGGSGSGLTINIPDDSTAWQADFIGSTTISPSTINQTVQTNTLIGDVVVAFAGSQAATASTNSATIGYQINGKQVYINSLYIGFGYYGVFNNVVDCHINSMHITDSFCSYKQSAGGDVTCPQAVFDSPTDHYLELDGCEGIIFKGRCFGTTSLTNATATVLIGSNYATVGNKQCRNLDLDFEFDNAGSTAGLPAASFIQVQASTFNFKISNIEGSSGQATTLPISAYAVFGAGVAANNNFLGRIDGVFGQIYSGTLPQSYFNIWDAAVPLQYGSLTATITGTATNSDTIRITATNVGIVGLPVTVTTTVTGGQTTTQIATQMAADFNATAALTAVGFSATSSANVVTYFESGSQSNNTVITQSVTGSATEIVTLSNSGAISGAISGGTFKTGGIYELIANGAPVSGTTQSTGLSKAIKGSTYLDTGTGNFYINTNTAANPVWVLNSGLLGDGLSVTVATTQVSDTSGLTYLNGALGVGATLTGTINTALTVDGVTFSALNQTLLVKNDTQSPSGAFNGVYYVTQLNTALLPPILTRALNYDTPSEMNGSGPIAVISGTANANSSWIQTATIVTIGTTPLTYSRFSYAPSTIQTGVFASKPGSPVQGQQYFATDLGTNGATIIYSGSIWKPLGGSAVIYQSGVQSTLSSTLGETNVKIVSIPQALLSVNGGLRVTAQCVKTGTGGTALWGWRLATVSGGINGTLAMSIASSASTKLSEAVVKTIWNRGSAISQVTSQIAGTGAGESTGTSSTLAVNTGSATFMNFTTQVGIGTDATGFDAITVEWLEP